MNESLKRILILSVVYGLLFIVPAFFGVLISYAAQPGGISQYNAFLAPILGPWSQILPPNSHPVSVCPPNMSCLPSYLVWFWCFP